MTTKVLFILDGEPEPFWYADMPAVPRIGDHVRVGWVETASCGFDLREQREVYVAKVKWDVGFRERVGDEVSVMLVCRPLEPLKLQNEP